LRNVGIQTGAKTLLPAVFLRKQQLLSRVHVDFKPQAVRV